MNAPSLPDNAPSLPDGRALRLRMARVDSLVSIPALAIIALYLVAMVDLTPGQWRTLLLAGAVFAAIVAAISEPLRRRHMGVLREHLDRRAQGGELPRAEIRQAFAVCVRLPVVLMAAMIGIWVCAAPGLALGAALLGDAGWLAPRLFVLLAVSGVSGGLVSSTFVYFSSKRALDDVRAVLAHEIADPEERRALIRPMPLARKLVWVVAGSSVAALVLATSVAYARFGRALDTAALDWAEGALAVVVERHASATLEAGDEEPGDADAGALDEAEHSEAETVSTAPAREFALDVDPRVLPYPISFHAFGAETPAPDAAVAAAQEAARGGMPSGRLDNSSADAARAWRVLPDGRVLVVSVPRGAIHAPLRGLPLVLAGALVVGSAFAFALALLMAADVRRAVATLSREAERMALGDLRRGAPVESDDELGDLGRSFERMGGALRATVGRVAEAADRVESASSEFAGVSESVAAASADQVRRIHQASELMLEIKNQVAEVAESAQKLNLSVEESSSSILELGAAGEELNDTASVLSERVDEVSSSIDQMVNSVRAVSNHTESLSDIAGETSSSMEEMASAMRAVDTTAEKTSELSASVVTHAERGQEKVRETIEGMEKIRDATDSAEGVIRGLDARTKEIGAILDVIDDVADETNLLALNAAIIAAQAGEHGRSFSVVADEIKELADRVLASTKEIGGLITAVQDESGNATGAIEVGARSVATGVELSADAGVSLEEITDSARESGSRIGEIVTAVREQTKAASRVSELMDQVKSGVEQIRAAGSEQDRGNEVVHRSSVTMREVAGQVRRTTEEQARGFGRIRESVEGVRCAVEQINRSLQEQSNACSQVAEFLEQVYERTQSNEESGRRMGDAMQGLVRQAEALREDVAKFRI